MRKEFQVRNAKPDEFQNIGRLLVNTYSKLEGFPKETEQPAYYKMLANIGEFTRRPKTEVLVAVSEEGEIGGAVVYFSDMQYYGSGGTATQEKNASGFRLLAVDTKHLGQGIGKILTRACIEKAKKDGNNQVVIHTTMSMQIAWKMYENLGFKRSEDLDFMQEALPVFGFRLSLDAIISD
ncbi:GNAT family N-acetyltransferase [Gramella jeungdoensis]|uniref:GNAT family N-acetyltransferase n=1 Tax=Gramella jeungdoensis TaxID=708091 RepID=A0ABT0Z137_9FLAO|nr:GNAT family N-acetyltransferase [Gramella jeungdoensis]MCM8569110.1 GNAT family N-acetyltransferase [Gramella jeungdoensis]